MEDAVRRGAERLDIISPGWHEHVNPATLDFATTTHCVLGQVFGIFEVDDCDDAEHQWCTAAAKLLDLPALASLYQTEMKVEAYGMALDGSVDASELVALWDKEIEKRLTDHE